MDMKEKLTDRQQEIFNFIQEYIEFNNYPPTYREIGSKFGISSTFGVKRHIDALVKKGYITNSADGKNRTITLSDQLFSSKNNSLEIPIVGRVAAGFPILAEENIEGKLTLDPSMIGGKNGCFALKVRGNSMINAGIFDGDVVVIHPNQNVRNGDIVIALIENEATMKRFQKDGNRIYLIPENDNYQPIVIESRQDFSIVGKVIGVFRWYN